MNDPRGFEPMNPSRQRFTTPIIVGIDDRPGWIRIAVEGGQCTEYYGVATPTTGRAGYLPDFITEEQGYCVGPNTPGSTPADLLSARHRVLVHEAMLVAGLAGKAAHVTTTLPAPEYFSGLGGRENLSLIGTKCANINTTVRSANSTPAAQVGMSQVFAQGVNAWVDFAVDQHGIVQHNLGKPAVVVEVGQRISDCTTVLPGYTADLGRCGAVHMGYGHYLMLLGHALHRRFGLAGLSGEVLLSATRSGFLEHEGRVFEIRETVAETQGGFVAKLYDEIVRRVGAAEEFYRMVFVGPGVKLLPQVQTVAMNAVAVEEPTFAGARGLVKYARHLA